LSIWTAKMSDEVWLSV